MAADHRDLTIEDFLCDAHAAKYRGEFDAHPAATGQLLAVLNDPANEEKLRVAEHPHDRPALTGIVHLLEADPAIAEVLASGPKGYRFRQTVGVAVKLRMAALGWTTTGRKGSVKGSKYFTKAEHYQPASPTEGPSAEQALAALQAVDRIGDDEEREATGTFLMNALASTRAQEGRPF